MNGPGCDKTNPVKRRHVEKNNFMHESEAAMLTSLRSSLVVFAMIAAFSAPLAAQDKKLTTG